MNPIVLALLCVFSWSFIPVVSKLGQAQIDSFQLLFWSNLLSALVIALAIKRDKLIIKASLACLSTAKGLVLNLILGFLGCCLYYLCLYYGYANTNPVQVLIIQYLWPALITVFAVFLLKERLNVKKVGSMLLGFAAAVLVITQGDLSSLDFANLDVLAVVFMGAIAFALFSVLSKKSSVLMLRWRFSFILCGEQSFQH